MFLLTLILATLSLAAAQDKLPALPPPLPSPSPSAKPTAAPVALINKSTESLPTDFTATLKFLSGEDVIEWNAAGFTAKLTDEIGDSAGFEIELILKGKIKDKAHSFMVNYHRVVPESDGSFKYKTIQRAETISIEVVEVNPNGTLKKGVYQVTIEHWTEAAKSLEVRRAQVKKFRLGLGVGATSMSFSETNSSIGTLSSIAVTVKLQADYLIGKGPWNLGLSGFYNALPVSGATGANQFQFLGMNLRIGKSMPWLKTPWELGLNAGWYYLTMITNGTFGFTNVSGPQLFPTLKRRFENGSSGSLYLKYSPIAASFSLMSLSNNEMAAGLQYNFAKKSKLQFGVSFDFSMVNLTATDSIGLNTTVKSQTMTLSGVIGI